MLAGTFDLDGEQAVNPDGGLKSFGHPIGASGLRMLFEAWLQLRSEAGQRQITSITRGRTLTIQWPEGDAVALERRTRRPTITAVLSL